ncbi:MAG: hypothetical protein LBK60_01615 [Verrucomicrobiales bacterium]|jgi:hypothetical protein|nr:hypothetical protein [Verrucomicrobiales bacterium]
MKSLLLMENRKHLRAESGQRLLVEENPDLHDRLLTESGFHLLTESGAKLTAERDHTVSAKFDEVTVELQDDGTLKVTWDGEFHNVEEFEILHSTDDGATWQTVGTVSGSTRSFNFPADALGVTQVIALGMGGMTINSSPPATDDEKNKTPSPSYIILDLASKSADGEPRGVNDSGVVLLGNNKLWSQNTLMSIGEKYQKVTGPLQNGCLYYLVNDPYWTEDSWLGGIPGTIVSQHFLHTWQAGVSTLLGIGERKIDYAYPESELFETVLSTYFITPANRKAIMKALPNISNMSFLQDSVSLNMVNDAGVYQSGGGIIAGDLTLVNEPQLAFQFLCVGNRCFIAQAKGNNLSKFAASESGERLVRLFHGTSGGVAYKRFIYVNWQQLPNYPYAVAGENSTYRIYVNGGIIPDATELCDINSVAGSKCFILGQVGTQTKLWAYDGSYMASITLGGTVSVNESGVVGRKISNQMLVPLGNKIWQGNMERWEKGVLTGKTWTTHEICGNPQNWENINVTLVSPDNNLLVGTAMKTKDTDGNILATPAERSVLLLPVEFVEVFPKLRDEGNNEINDSEKPLYSPGVNGMIKERRTNNALNIAYRSLHVRVPKELLAASTVRWTMTPLPGEGGANIRGQWPATGDNVNRFAAADGTANAYSYTTIYP